MRRKNIYANMGVNMRAALLFARRHPDSWHSYAKDKRTRAAIRRLAKRGLVLTYRGAQFKAIPFPHVKES